MNTSVVLVVFFTSGGSVRTEDLIPFIPHLKILRFFFFFF